MNYKLLLAAALVVVSAMCLEGFFGTDMSLAATRQGTSDTFDISLSFTAIDENGTAIAGAALYCSDSPSGAYSLAGTTDSQGNYSSSSFLVSTISPADCPKKGVTRYCYAQKGDVRTGNLSGTVELTCYVTPTATPIQTASPTSTPTATPTPAATRAPTAACGDTHTGAWPKSCDAICTEAGTACVKQSSCDGICVNKPCGNSCGGTGDINGCVCAAPTPTLTPASAVNCGDTDYGAHGPCSGICSAAGKTCVKMSSCDGGASKFCLSKDCSNVCGSGETPVGCVCS